MRILHVNSSDHGGGAERIARDLCRASRRAGHAAWLAVGRRLSDDDDVLPIPNIDSGGRWRRFWLRRGDTDGSPSWRARAVRGLADPLGLLARALGREDFRHPGTSKLLELPPSPADVLHLHNLHGGYFDLRRLEKLSSARPTFVTLHDPWLLTGHCAHPFECERWKHGCGACPDLSIYPPLHRDGTAYNWRRKQSIYRRSKLFVATPSRWLMERVEQSMLMPAVAESRVIPNGIDLETFHPGDRAAARRSLDLPPDGPVMLLVSAGRQRNCFRDSDTQSAAVSRLLAGPAGGDLNIVALGEADESTAAPHPRIRFDPHQRAPEVVASYYRAADLFVHASRADTFPSVVLEAGACGIPVVASAVGGIPEQLRPGATGELVPPADVDALVAAITTLLADPVRRTAMGEAAASHVRDHFSLDRMAGDYLAWYQRILDPAGAGSAM